MSKEGSKVRFLISVPDELHGSLKDISKRYGKPLTGLIRDILWNWLESQSK